MTATNVSFNPRLTDAVSDAQVLLSYISQTGGSVDVATVKTVVDTAAEVRNGSVSNEQEAAFWLAFNALAKVLSPISLSSLRATLDSYALGRKSQARKAVTIYTIVAVITLVLLLVFQIYWLFGNSITGELQKQRKDITDLDAKIVSTQMIPAGAAKPAPSPNPDLVALRMQLENLQMKRDASNELLRAWGRIWEKNSPVMSACNSGDYLEDPGKQESCKNAVRYQAVLVVLDVLQRYFLPLLYGLLGSCVYVLRSLSMEIKTRTYSEASNIGFRIRLYLGMLSGLTVAWFVTPDASDSLLKSLSPLALAFLAGYCIELVFSAMDRILGAFTTESPAAPASPPGATLSIATTPMPTPSAIQPPGTAHTPASGGAVSPSSTVGAVPAGTSQQTSESAPAGTGGSASEAPAEVSQQPHQAENSSENTEKIGKFPS